MPLTAVIIASYLVGVALAYYHGGRDHSWKSRLWTAVWWWLFAIGLFVLWVWSIITAFADIHESRNWYKRSWSRVIRDYPVLGRIYKFVTLGRGT